MASAVICALLSAGVAATCGGHNAAPPTATLASEILADGNLPVVLAKARALVQSGLNAGSGYDEIWIRDLNTFIELAASGGHGADVRAALLTLVAFQGKTGDIPDGVTPKKRPPGRMERESALAPGMIAHKNTVETDQESSLVQAVRKYVAITGDRSILDERVGARKVIDRLGEALDYVISERFDAAHGLVWGATTVDWGDVQPETEFGVELDASSHRAIDIYDNAMFVIAIDDYLQLLPAGDSRAPVWTARRADLQRNIRKYLWDTARQKFIPHVYLNGSPFPAGFDESAIYYHGGTAVAMEAGLLDHDEIAASIAAINENVRKAGAGSVGLSIYPAYPAGFFKKRSMQPYDYQNGGDWPWFGGRLVQQLVRNGFVREGFVALKPMVERVKKDGDFFEFWSLDNRPRGSAQFRGTAGVLGVAMEELLAWATTQHQAELSK